MYFDTKEMEKFAQKFLDRLMDGRISYYLKKEEKGYKANAVHASIIWSREVVAELNKRNYVEIKEMQISDLLLLIFYVDILLEATDQIYRVLYNTKKTVVLTEKEIFLNKPKLYSHLDDCMYFKELRAIFGAHPVNLKEPGSNEVRFADIPMKPNPMFSSLWFPPIEGKYDFYERLWTATRKDENTIFIPLNISEILEFASVLLNRFSQFNERLKIIAYHRDEL
ncbi:MAG: hypothetical protein IJZ00_02720 [Lachnospiraceae bacterium]|nr:hypothetical protein [Lachnospiraceae bacterium]